MDLKTKVATMFSRAQHNAGGDSSTKRNAVTAKLSISLLRQWDFFRNMRDEDLSNIKSFYVFPAQPSMSCPGGVAAIFITLTDEVLGLGHNCTSINILGFSRDTPGYKKERIPTPTTICTLCQKNIKELSVGSLVGAAITGCGALLWWGQCDRRHEEIMTPHAPKSSRRKYFRVSCGHRMMVALSESKKVFVWGQIVSNNSRFMDGEQILVNAVISEVACGFHHLAMLDKEGCVFTWGRGNEGQRGLPDYTFSDQYHARKVAIDPCTNIKCGPYSTFCLTKFRELRACGSNCELHLGTDDCRKSVRMLSSISISEAVMDVVVLWGSDDIAKIAACTTNGDIYTWGLSARPNLSDAQSFFDVFTAWEVTPGLTSVSSPSSICGWSISNIITPRELKSINVNDALTYVYLRDRPDLAVHSSRYCANVSTRDISYLSSQITSEESGKHFILEKFFKDAYLVPQDSPAIEDGVEDGVDDYCPCPTTQACSFGCCYL